MTIKDKNGLELHFGDMVRCEKEISPVWSYYRYCYAGMSKRSTRRGPVCAVYGVFVDGGGRKATLSADTDGTINQICRIAAMENFAEVKTGSWVNDCADEKTVAICSCCGSLMPVATEMDKITVEDNRYCSFCGARMRVMDNDG